MPTRPSDATWEGKLQTGRGTVTLGSGAFSGEYSFASRFEQGTGTNPEELIAAAHAGCYSMALAHALEEKGYDPQRVHTTAKVSLEQAEGGFQISTIDLETEADVADIDEKAFEELAQAAKTNCPVSKALAGAEIRLRLKKLVS